MDDWVATIPSRPFAIRINSIFCLFFSTDPKNLSRSILLIKFIFIVLIYMPKSRGSTGYFNVWLGWLEIQSEAIFVLHLFEGYFIIMFAHKQFNTKLKISTTLNNIPLI